MSCLLLLRDNIAPFLLTINDRTTGYQIVEHQPEFGFSKSQLVAMKVYKIGNETTVDIIPGGDVQASTRVLHSISAYLPPNQKSGSIKGDQLSSTTSHAHQTFSVLLLDSCCSLLQRHSRERLRGSQAVLAFQIVHRERYHSKRRRSAPGYVS